jgi:3-phenylpropionate/trans-cinnamate dioxygenase ferredoxin subunit
MQWVKIFGSENEAKQRIQSNKPQLVILDGQRICLVRHLDKFFAVQDSCTHSGASLSAGHINYLGEIICPLHNYCFNLQSGSELSSRSVDLRTYPIKIDETGFFIGV